MKKKNKPRPNYKKFQACSFDKGLTKEEKILRDELKEYRDNHPKPWYL